MELIGDTLRTRARSACTACSDAQHVLTTSDSQRCVQVSVQRPRPSVIMSLARASCSAGGARTLLHSTLPLQLPRTTTLDSQPANPAQPTQSQSQLRIIHDHHCRPCCSCTIVTLAHCHMFARRLLAGRSSTTLDSQPTIIIACLP